jgi:protein-S-isoprenylcysteine O-methyltransferase Ste14
MAERPGGRLRRTVLRQLSLVVFAAFLFIPAGTVRFWQGWLFAFVFIGVSSALGLYFKKHDPALLARRMQVGPFAEREPTQRIIISLVTIGFILLIVLPGLDHRWHWSNTPVWLVLVGEAGIILSFVIFFFVMKQNSYAASTVRVERDQPVVSAGLYGTVRHPMYSGALLLLISIPIALGSYWTLPLAILLVPLLVWRLTDEECVLVRDLPGYAAYRQTVRYRLIPGVW